MKGLNDAHGWWRVVALAAAAGIFLCLLTFHYPVRWMLPLAAVELALLLIAPVRAPDGFVPGVATAGVLIWWLAGGPSPWWQATLTVLPLAVYWVATAWIAEAPPWSAYAPGMLARRLRRLGGFVGATLAGALLIGLAVAVSPLPFGGLWAALGVVALLLAVSAAAWLINRASL